MSDLYVGRTLVHRPAQMEGQGVVAVGQHQHRVRRGVPRIRAVVLGHKVAEGFGHGHRVGHFLAVEVCGLIPVQQVRVQPASAAVHRLERREQGLGVERRGQGHARAAVERRAARHRAGQGYRPCCL